MSGTRMTHMSEEGKKRIAAAQAKIAAVDEEYPLQGIILETVYYNSDFYGEGLSQRQMAEKAASYSTADADELEAEIDRLLYVGYLCEVGGAIRFTDTGVFINSEHSAFGAKQYITLPPLTDKDKHDFLQASIEYNIERSDDYDELRQRLGIVIEQASKAGFDDVVQQAKQALANA